MKHIKPEQYYIDLYDRHTVDECRRIEQSFARSDDPLPEDGSVTPKQAEAVKNYARKLYLRLQSGERYLNKSKRIRELMDADRHRDEQLESAQPPEGIRCLTCRNLVKPTFKDLSYSVDDKKPERVLFMFDCPNECVPRRAFYSDGEEYRVKPDLCPRCDVPLDLTSDDDGKKLTTTKTCPKCGHVDKDEYVWSKKEEEEYDEHFARDRDRFCLTDEEGQKYLDEKWRMEQMGKLGEEFKEREKALAEKLEANPNGFILEGVGRTCFICGESSREDGSWYDSYGLKCLVCQKAIDEGEIPPTLAKDKDSWYSKYDLEHLFNLDRHGLKRWLKEGIIKSRTVSQYGKGVHTELFLIEDNKGFLPPKKMLESHWVEEIKDGKTWTRMAPWYQFVDPLEYLKDYAIIKHMRVVPPEEMAAREEEKKRKWEEKQAKRKARKNERTK